MPHKDPEKRKEYGRRYREKNKEKIQEYLRTYREAHDFSGYKREWYANKRFDKYGITREIFSQLLDKQEHRCAICSSQFTEKNRPHIDHCHTKGNVRGLLCLHCNTGLGQFRDSIELLTKAKEYLTI